MQQYLTVLDLTNYWQNHFEFYHQWPKGSRLVTQVNWKALPKKIIPLKELTLLMLRLISLHRCSGTTTTEALECKVSLTLKNFEQENVNINKALWAIMSCISTYKYLKPFKYGSVQRPQ